MRAALPSAQLPQVMEVLERFKNDANFVKDSMARMQDRARDATVVAVTVVCVTGCASCKRSRRF